VLNDTWIDYYCDIINEAAGATRRYTCSSLLDVILEEFKARGVVNDNDGYLSCEMRR
jgi:hypothetical protein